MRPALWVFGGLSLGSGILLAIGDFQGQGGFGIADADGAFVGHAADVFHTTGYDTTADLMIFSQGWLALVLAVAGVAMMVYANAGAWKETGGY